MYYYIFAPTQAPRGLERYAQIKQYLAELGIAGELVTPVPGRDCEQLVALAIEKRYSTVVAVGDSSHVNRIARALEPYDAVLGIIPTNPHPDLTRLIGTSDWKEAAELLKRRRVHEVPMGCINEQINFLTPASITLPSELPSHLQTADYTAALFGGELQIAVTAQTEGEVLSITCTQPTLQASGIAKLFSKKATSSPLTELQATACQVSTQPSSPVYLAGEQVATTPVRFSLRPHHLRLIARRESSQSLQES